MASKLKEIERQQGRPMAEILRELYHELGSQAEVAARLGVSQGTISLWFIRFGLKLKVEKSLEVGP